MKKLFFIIFCISTFLSCSVVRNGMELNRFVTNESPKKVVIRGDIDLNGKTLSFPEGCKLVFKKGSISNGSIFFNSNCIKGNVRFINCNYRGTIDIKQIDDRIFPFGKFIRKAKIDEMPQVVNILKGQMSVVGPRPEDKVNADKVYVGENKHILAVKPGLTSTASLYDYTHGELFEDEESYEKVFLPRKLELELYYVNHRSFWYDLQLILRTGWLIILKTCGKTQFKVPKEMKYCK